ncbi:carbohydrate ABC transporter permease, partial [Halobacillus sp. BBL2006]|uniref:carbohydrate ABC transporter permease n=2 Tax=Halobacillus TaxID=45667 RepID=UPI000542745F
FAKFQFKGRNAIFFMLLVAIMIPYHVTLIPLFEIFSNVGWLNTFQAVILPQVAYPFAIFLMRQNMQAIPDSLLEAARVDGAGEFHIFFRIVLPVMRPALAAVAIFLFMFQWNNFIWPLVVLQSQDMYTLPVALSSLVGMSRIDYGQVMMGTTLSTLPIMIFFLLLQKQFISGILGGSVKE